MTGHVELVVTPRPEIRDGTCGGSPGNTCRTRRALAVVGDAGDRIGLEERAHGNVVDVTHEYAATAVGGEEQIAAAAALIGDLQNGTPRHLLIDGHVPVLDRKSVV